MKFFAYSKLPTYFLHNSLLVISNFIYLDFFDSCELDFQKSRVLTFCSMCFVNFSVLLAALLGRLRVG